MATYPQRLVQTRSLADGTQVTLRPIRPQDAGLEQEFVRHLSPESRYFRFMGTLQELSPRKLKSFAEVDYERSMAFIATLARDAQDEGRQEAIGFARYVATEQPTTCEFAIAVGDAWHRSGVAGILMNALMDAARERGFKTMQGIVLRSNHTMLKFARQLGFALCADPLDADTVAVERAL